MKDATTMLFIVLERKNIFFIKKREKNYKRKLKTEENDWSPQTQIDQNSVSSHPLSLKKTKKIFFSEPFFYNFTYFSHVLQIKNSLCNRVQSFGSKLKLDVAYI